MKTDERATNGDSRRNMTPPQRPQREHKVPILTGRIPVQEERRWTEQTYERGDWSYKATAHTDELTGTVAICILTFTLEAEGES